jgi:hypothetical protein
MINAPLRNLEQAGALILKGTAFRPYIPPQLLAGFAGCGKTQWRPWF